MRLVTPRPREGAESSRALEDLYREHAGWLTRGLRRRFGRQLSSEDLVQETYLRAARVVASTAIRQPRAVLWRIATSIAIDQLRRLRAGERALQRSPAISEEPSSQEMTVLLRELVTALPDTVRDTFVLNRFAGLSYAEIAQRQGVSVKTVEWRMSRALTLLAARVSE